jgi:hypothetical protein
VWSGATRRGLFVKIVSRLQNLLTWYSKSAYAMGMAGRNCMRPACAVLYIYCARYLSLSLTHTHMHTQHCPPLSQVSPLHRSPSDSRRSTLERSRRRRTSGGRRTRAPRTRSPGHPNDRYHAHTARVRAAYASHYGYGCSRASFPHYCYCSPPANTSPPPILRPAAARPAAAWWRRYSTSQPARRGARACGV